MTKIKVIVSGACGKMGQEAVKAISREENLELSGAVDVSNTGKDIGQMVLGEPMGIKIGDNLEAAIRECSPDVMVNFTVPSAVKEQIHTSMQMGVTPVVGTTGLTEPDLNEIDRWVQHYRTGIIIAPNFALGAVMMMQFARLAARYFGDAEIIEMHHENKVDAPSGTAIKTAEMIQQGRSENLETEGSGAKEGAESGSGAESGARPESESEPGKGAGSGAGMGIAKAKRPKEVEKISGSRGGEANGVHLHSVRMPGKVAHQEVIFGGPGQTLTIRHDSLDRSSFMPGLIMAINKTPGLQKLIYGIENLLDF